MVRVRFDKTNLWFQFRPVHLELSDAVDRGESVPFGGGFAVVFYPLDDSLDEDGGMVCHSFLSGVGGGIVPIVYSQNSV